MIHSCVEQSCIVDANLYDDIGECSLSTDSWSRNITKSSKLILSKNKYDFNNI